MMTEQDKAGIDYLLSMERAGLLTPLEVFDDLVEGSWWSAQQRKVISHGKKRRR